MKSNFSLTMNRTASDTIAAIEAVDLYFLEDSSTSFSIRMFIITFGSESGNKSDATYTVVEDRKKGSAIEQFCKKGVCEAKRLGTSGLSYALLKASSFLSVANCTEET